MRLRRQAGWTRSVVAAARAASLAFFLLLIDGAAMAMMRARQPQPIVWADGSTVALVQGEVRPASGHGDRRQLDVQLYGFKAQAGQRLNIEIRSMDGKAAFSLRGPAGQGQPSLCEPAAQAIEKHRWTGRLRCAGEHRISVFTPGWSGGAKFELQVTLQ